MSKRKECDGRASRPLGTLTPGGLGECSTRIDLTGISRQNDSLAQPYMGKLSYGWLD